MISVRRMRRFAAVLGGAVADSTNHFFGSECLPNQRPESPRSATSSTPSAFERGSEEPPGRESGHHAQDDPTDFENRCIPLRRAGGCLPRSPQGYTTRVRRTQD